MTSFTLSADRVDVYEKETGMKFESCSKLCDFCDCWLPRSWIGIQCILCPTIYDICTTCLEKREIELDICHQHVTPLTVPKDPARLTTQEKSEIMSVLSPKIVIYAESFPDRENGQLCDYCRVNFDNPDLFEASKCQKYHVSLISLKKIMAECSPSDFTNIRKICDKYDVMVQAHHSCGAMLMKI